MNRYEPYRKNFSISTSQCPQSQQISILTQQVKLKNKQLHDIKFQLNALKMKQSIIHSIDEKFDRIKVKMDIDQQHRSIFMENQKLKTQIYRISMQLQNKNFIIEEQSYQINKLREENLELRRFYQKYQQTHKKEFQLLLTRPSSYIGQTSTFNKQAQYFRDTKQKPIYKNLMKDASPSRMRPDSSCHRRFQSIQREKPENQKQKMQEITQRNYQQILPNDEQTFKRIGNSWETVATQMNQHYKSQIFDLKSQIRLLRSKIQNIQESKHFEIREDKGLFGFNKKSKEQYSNNQQKNPYNNSILSIPYANTSFNNKAQTKLEQLKEDSQQILNKFLKQDLQAQSKCQNQILFPDLSKQQQAQAQQKKVDAIIQQSEIEGLVSNYQSKPIKANSKLLQRKLKRGQQQKVSVESKKNKKSTKSKSKKNQAVTIQKKALNDYQNNQVVNAKAQLNHDLSSNRAYSSEPFVQLEASPQHKKQDFLFSSTQLQKIKFKSQQNYLPNQDQGYQVEEIQIDPVENMSFVNQY